MVQLAATYVQPNISALFCIACTLILAISEVSPLYHRLLNLALILKHLGLWIRILTHSCEITLWPFGFFPCFWSLAHVMVYVSSKKDILAMLANSVEALRNEEQLLDSLLQSVPDGIAVVGEKLQVLAFNRSLLTQLGLPTDAGAAEIQAEVEKLHYAEGYFKGSNMSLATDIRDLVRKQFGEVLSFPPAEKAGCFLESRGVVARWRQQQVIILTVRDTTKWVELEAKAQLENQHKTAMLRSVSHELRTPTNAILNLAQDLQNNEHLSVQGQSDLEVVISATSFLLSLINDLLDFSRILHGKFSLLKRSFALEPLLRQCTHLFDLQCKAKNLELRVRLDPHLPTHLYSDENRLRQVLLNLLSNAMKFTLHGSVTVVALVDENNCLRLSVVDTGIGIDEANQHKIFGLFGKLEGNQAINPLGCGLGLGISSLLVERLGGSPLSLQSRPGRGSTFSFTLSLNHDEGLVVSRVNEMTSEDEETFAQVPCLTDWNGGYVRPYRPEVMVVDDSTFNRIVARKLVETQGFRCAEASTGKEAVKLALAQHLRGYDFEVVLMDIEMPELNGLEATQQLRRLERESALQHLVIVGCSANASQEDRQQALDAGMDYYIEKPINRQELNDLLLLHITH
jgi:signal transduction histidine kinase/ActR/RegA family two-component response regulator